MLSLAVSNLSNYGSGSLKNLQQLSYKEISRSQEKNYNIVSNQDRRPKNERILKNYAEMKTSDTAMKLKKQLVS